MQSLWKNIFRTQTSRESFASLLSSTPMFSKLRDRDLDILKSFFHPRHYSADELIFEQGEPASGMYLIRTGSVRILFHKPDGTGAELARLGPGDFFGESSLAVPGTRNATARTLESAELLGFFHSDLQDILEKHPSLAGRLLFGLASTLGIRLQTCSAELLRDRLGVSACPIEPEEEQDA